MSYSIMSGLVSNNHLISTVNQNLILYSPLAIRLVIVEVGLSLPKLDILFCSTVTAKYKDKV